MNKLIKGRPMDNLEFLQWLRGFFEVCVRQREREKQRAGERVRKIERRRMCVVGRGGGTQGE